MIPSILMSRLSDIFELEYINPSLNLIKNNLYLNQSRIDEDPINRLIDHYKMTSNQPEFIKDTNKLGRGVSVSRLETYNKCPFSYYIKYGLKINEQKEDTLQHSELGSLCHYLMEKCLDDESLVDAEAKHYIEENLKEKYDNHPMNQYFIDNLITDMKMTIKIIQKRKKYLVKLVVFLFLVLLIEWMSLKIWCVLWIINQVRKKLISISQYRDLIFRCLFI